MTVIEIIVIALLCTLCFVCFFIQARLIDLLRADRDRYRLHFFRYRDRLGWLGREARNLADEMDREMRPDSPYMDGRHYCGRLRIIADSLGDTKQSDDVEAEEPANDEPIDPEPPNQESEEPDVQ